MSISFKAIESPPSENEVNILYDLLCKRNNFISHRSMPLFEDHETFVKSEPYRIWYLVYSDKEAIGSFYISNQNSIGINIENHQKIELIDKIIKYIEETYLPMPLIKSIRTDKFHINVPPTNRFLINSLDQLSKKLIQITYLIK